MKNTTKIIILTILLFSSVLTVGFAVQKERQSNPVAVLKTSMGTIEVELFQHAAPQTVANFIGLAEGTKAFTDPKSGSQVKRKYFDGLIFHRVIKDFMIQGGCPLGTGTGNPGYTFKDEMNADSLGLNEMKALTPQGEPNQLLGIRSQEQFNSYILAPLFEEMGISTQEELDKRIEEFQALLSKLSVKDVFEGMGYEYQTGIQSYEPLKGYLAMANSGPNTNGSQFFINLIDTPWLIGKHTVFGKVIKGMDVVEAIGIVATNSGNKPDKDIKIISVTIQR
ncbi:MAG: peptidylprolyl isomerase [Spirochaetes bacterium]|nr:MAG: peptidylprolyl isomerase [Spirochaetota bacterium]